MTNPQSIPVADLPTAQIVLEFRHLTREYCALIDSHQDFSQYDFIRMCLNILPSLYTKALNLPEFNPTNDTVPEDRITNEQWGTIFGSLRTKLDKHDMYSEVFDPIYPENDDPTQSSLADDLADIYRDQKNGLMYWETESATRHEDAVWQWQFNFRTHWGQHLTSALRALHFLVFDHMSEE